MPDAESAFNFVLTLSQELQVRDIRAVLVLLALAGNERSVASQAGVSVQFLADRIRESEEACRHLLRSLRVSGLATCCGRVQRTHLFALTDEAVHKLGCLLAGS